MKLRNKNGNNTKYFSRILLSGFSLGAGSLLRQAGNSCSRTLGLLSTPRRARSLTPGRAVHPMEGQTPDHGRAVHPTALPTWTRSPERPQGQQCRNGTCPHPPPTQSTKRNLDLSCVHSDTPKVWALECVCSCWGGGEQPDHNHPGIQAQPLTPTPPPHTLRVGWRLQGSSKALVLFL